MRWKRRGWSVVLAAVAVVAGAVMVTTPSNAAQGPAAEADSFVTLSLNMCGNKCNDGRLGVADATADAILDRPTRPRFAMLQEVCAGQAQRIRTRLADANYQVVHVPTRNRCDDGSAYGIGIAYKGVAAWYRVYDLPNPRNHEPRKMVCAMLDEPRTLGCSTHIDFHADGTRGAQIKEVARLMDGFAEAGHPAYVAGDFNTEPGDDQLDVMYVAAYGGGATGRHNEAGGCCQRGGQATGDGGRKIDYTFALAGKFAPNWSDAVPMNLSDHHKLWASLTLR